MERERCGGGGVGPAVSTKKQQSPPLHFICVGARCYCSSPGMRKRKVSFFLLVAAPVMDGLGPCDSEAAEGGNPQTITTPFRRACHAQYFAYFATLAGGAANSNMPRRLSDTEWRVALLTPEEMCAEQPGKAAQVFILAFRVTFKAQML